MNPILALEGHEEQLLQLEDTGVLGMFCHKIHLCQSTIVVSWYFSDVIVVNEYEDS